LDLHCTHSAMGNAYSWFVTNNVRTTWESWGCEMSDGMGGFAVVANDGLAEDWHARETNITVVKSSGDISMPDDPCGATGGDGRQTAWGCVASNSLCVGGLTPSNDQSGISSDRNVVDDLSLFPAMCVTDREDPDVVALSDAVTVMGFLSTTDWSATKTGTSFSAPTMAALAALLKQKCNTNLSPLRERAIIMTSAWFFDAGQPFPTLGAATPPTDYFVGTGGPTADNALLWCGLTSGSLVVGDVEQDIEYGSGTPADTGMDQPASGKPDSNPTNWKYSNVTSVSLSAGDRIRATVTWNTCADGMHTPTIIGTDIDLWLCKPAVPPSTTSTCIASSRSLANNWEAFDQTISSSQAGTYNIRVGYDTTRSGCGDNPGGEVSRVAWVRGPAADFTAF
ncbi:MAG TPA: S8 family serine peptidase, partial [Polyangiaceae bacterium]|nr:S8 family serine peptidase [Polyangiaceae bacterium]